MYNLFGNDDAKVILGTFVPQGLVVDRIVWYKSNDGIYSLNTGYKLWHD